MVTSVVEKKRVRIIIFVCSFGHNVLFFFHLPILWKRMRYQIELYGFQTLYVLSSWKRKGVLFSLWTSSWRALKISRISQRYSRLNSLFCFVVVAVVVASFLPHLFCSRLNAINIGPLLSIYGKTSVHVLCCYSRRIFWTKQRRSFSVIFVFAMVMKVLNLQELSLTFSSLVGRTLEFLIGKIFFDWTSQLIRFVPSCLFLERKNAILSLYIAVQESDDLVFLSPLTLRFKKIDQRQQFFKFSFFISFDTMFFFLAFICLSLFVHVFLYIYPDIRMPMFIFFLSRNRIPFSHSTSWRRLWRYVPIVCGWFKQR